MSEYQHYEFQAVDRPLSDAEMRVLRAVSTRAEITPTRFVNFYTWGDFKGNPSAWMERYFDAFLYLANWGTHELMLRVPRRMLDPRTAKQYCRGESASARGTSDFTILELHSEDESREEEADDGTGWLASLLPLRAELASGDHRALYLAWLLCAQNEELGEDDPEPPVPPGLGQLTAAQRVLADFLRIDRDLVAAAAERSREEETPTREELARWIATLPRVEKDRFLLRTATGQESHPRADLLRRFREASAAPDARPAAPRTVAELRAAAEHQASERRRREAERAEAERARRQREEAQAQERRLERLAKRQDEAWRRVDELVASKQSEAYEEAVQLLGDLLALGSKEGRAAEVEERIRGLRERHARKWSFVERLRNAGLAGPTR